MFVNPCFCLSLSLKSPSPSTLPLLLSPPKSKESMKDEDVFPHLPRSNFVGVTVELFMTPLKNGMKLQNLDSHGQCNVTNRSLQTCLLH